MQKNVLVTGASTGIGFDCVRALIENRFTPIATVRKQEDLDRLKSEFGDKVKVLILDLTDFNQIENLPHILKNELNITELFGLVNNAGAALAAPFIYQDFSEVENIIRVNVLSLMKVTQVLLPLMKNCQGRIVNISSVAGKSAAPFLSVYAASKHAVEGFSEGLRKELMLYNMKVIVVGPGSINTPIWKKGFDIIRDKYANTDYAVPFARFIKLVTSEVSHSLEVSQVSACIIKALTSQEPRFRYAPIPRKLINWYIPRIMPAKIYNKLTAKTLKLSK